MGADYHLSRKAATYQPPEVLNQANPTQNLFYTIGNVMLNAVIYTIAVNIEDTNETLEVQAIVDGETITAAAGACVHSNSYTAFLQADAVNRQDWLALKQFSQSTDRSHQFEGRSVEIQVRKTTAAGVGNLTGVVMWGQY